MIISASRRTDIPSRYGRWLVNRLREGYTLVRNPYNQGFLSRVDLSPDKNECVVFWTKDAAPFLQYLNEIDEMGYKYVFQYTLTPYGAALEPGLPCVSERIETVKRLSERVGAALIDWRYDPVIVCGDFTADFHVREFERLCRELSGCVSRCIISFVDVYRKMRGQFEPVCEADMLKIAEGISQIAHSYSVRLFTCAEKADLSAFGIGHSACIDAGRISQALGIQIDSQKDPGQRESCNCAQSYDIGAYDTCPNGCAYCYANASPAQVARAIAAHDAESPMLSGRPAPNAVIKRRA